jgi:hypothetical protein
MSPFIGIGEEFWTSYPSCASVLLFPFVIGIVFAKNDIHALPWQLYDTPRPTTPLKVPHGASDKCQKY